jgi:hypothetical protein
MTKSTLDAVLRRNELHVWFLGEHVVDVPLAMAV